MTSRITRYALIRATVHGNYIMFSFWQNSAAPRAAENNPVYKKEAVTVHDEPFIIQDYLPNENDYTLLPIQPFKPQKNIVKNPDQFNITSERQKFGHSKPVIAHKQCKDGAHKLFSLKSSGRYECFAIAEKTYFDLLALCGVIVPKSYLVKTEQGRLSQIASHMEPGYKDLVHYLEGKTEIHKGYKWDLTALASQLSSQTIHAKPIKGLFENIAVFVFLLDVEAIGPSFTNIGLIEMPNHMQAVKIDPGSCSISGYNNDRTFKIAFAELIQHKFNKIDGNSSENKRVYEHATQDQILDGMQRVADLTDFQLSRTINNKQFPDVEHWGKKEKADALKTLIARRNTFREHLAALKSRNKSGLRFD